MERRAALFPLIELAFVSLIVVFFILDGPTANFVRDLAFLCLALPLAVICRENTGYTAPDIITLPGTLVGFAVSLIPGSIGIVSSIEGAAILLIILLVVAWVSPWLFGKEGVGGGVIKAGMMVGAFCGFPSALLVLCLAIILGIVGGAVFLWLGKIARGAYVSGVDPLLAGATIAMICGDAILGHVFG